MVDRALVLLLAEPNPNLSSVVAGVLRAEAYLVLAAATAEEALAFCEELADIDLLVTELTIPEIGGIALAERVRERLPKINVLYLSSIAERPLRAQFIGNQGDVLEKPVALSAFVSMVRQLLGG